MGIVSNRILIESNRLWNQTGDNPRIDSGQPLNEETEASQATPAGAKKY